jgi:hypothetical protein
MSLFALDGRVALVTGAGSPGGIGFACARTLRELGASVAVAATSDRIQDRASELGGGSKGFVADLTDPAQVARLVAEVESSLGPVDLLVNNAGMTSVTDEESWLSITEMSPEQWRSGIMRNLDTAFLVTRAVMPGMRNRGFGRIVNVTSTSGTTCAMPNEASYVAGKGGRSRPPPPVSRATQSPLGGSARRRRSRRSSSTASAHRCSGWGSLRRSRPRSPSSAHQPRRTSPVRRSSSMAATRSARPTPHEDTITSRG